MNTLYTQKPLHFLSQKEEHSQGRLFDEPLHSFRNPYQRDRDRIIHCKAFRRLEAKTQVLVNLLSTNDHFRTRLTHSLEVSQISRTIGRYLGLHEDLIEAVALAHDLGHPPFGHAGEKVLHEWMKDHGGFEHNVQSYRIVSKLEKKYPHFDGLNLTYEVRFGLIKHRKKSKYKSLPLFSEFNLDLEPILEAQVADLADEITYSCHDLEDGLLLNFISAEELLELSFFKDIKLKIKLNDIKKKEIEVYQIIRILLETLVKDVLIHSAETITKNHIKDIHAAVAHKTRLISLSKPVRTQLTELKRFLHRKFYRHDKILEMTQLADKCLSFLCNHYLHHPKDLPQYTRQRFMDQPSKRIICDYVAGMTDRYAIVDYQSKSSLSLR